MQNLLRFCGLDSAVTQRSRDVQADEKYRRWSELPETVRNTLTPFLTSKYTVTVGAVNSSCTYPLFSATLTHGEWLRTFVQDLLQKGSGDNARLVFSVSSRIVKGQDVSIASFLLPFAVLNRIVGGTQKEKEDLLYELTSVLSHPLPDSTNHIYEAILLCSQVSALCGTSERSKGTELSSHFVYRAFSKSSTTFQDGYKARKSSSIVLGATTITQAAPTGRRARIHVWIQMHPKLRLLNRC